MTRSKTAIGAMVVAVAVALAGAGISHIGQTRTSEPPVPDRSVAAELDVSGDRTVLVEGRLRGSDQEEAGSEMSTGF
jgi:hypothetical protein